MEIILSLLVSGMVTTTFSLALHRNKSIAICDQQTGRAQLPGKIYW